MKDIKVTQVQPIIIVCILQLYQMRKVGTLLGIIKKNLDLLMELMEVLQLLMILGLRDVIYYKYLMTFKEEYMMLLRIVILIF